MIAGSVRIGPSGVSGRIVPSAAIGRSAPSVPNVRIGRSVPSARSGRIGPNGQVVADMRWFLTALLVAATPAIASAQSGEWQVGTAPSFSSGTYGTDGRTEVLHTPFTVRRHFDDGDLAVVFPITCIRGAGGVTVVSGSPVRTEPSGSRAGTGGTTGRTGTTAPARGSGDPVPVAAPAPVADCGLGDIVVRGRYYLVDERGWLPTIALRAHVKAPTANAQRGLGTGQPDEGIGIEVSRLLAGGLMVMVDGGYTMIGRPVGVDFNNTWWYDVGVGQRLGGRVDVSAFFEEYAAIAPGLPSARELLGAVSVRAAAGWRFQITGLIGLSEGAPDHGLTLGASRRF
jgi:hypothetical protein